MKTSISRLLPGIIVLIFPFSCKSDFLEITPNGSLDANILATKDGVTTLLVGAYSMLDGVSSQGFGLRFTAPLREWKIDLMGGRLVQNR